MTLATAPPLTPGGPAPTPAPAPAPPRSYRWLRLVIPFAVVGLFWAFSYGMRAYQDPDMSDAGSLSPAGTGRHGSSELAERLAAAGVTLERVTSSDDALEALRGGDATLFVPAPDLAHPMFLLKLTELRGAYRIVLVRPGLLARLASGMPVDVAQARWFTGVAAPECATDYAARAGAATVHRDRYAAFEGMPTPDTLCYGGSLIGYDIDELELLFIGATEPFRNDRIDEHGNSALATGLLGAHERVIWLDLHQREPVDIQFELPEFERGDQDRTNTGDPLLDAFPSQLWAITVLLLVGGALFALVRARRLGPPVTEPLPVLVPAAEAITGRGRLYERIRARQSSLATLREATIARLARTLAPLATAPERSLGAPGPARDSFVAQVAARAGLPPATVAAVLYGPSPEDDQGLVRAATDLDRLVAAVAAAAPAPPSTTDPDPMAGLTPHAGPTAHESPTAHEGPIPHQGGAP